MYDVISEHEVTYVGESKLPFQTCMNGGIDYYRTFDGVEYTFGGTCAYILAQTEQWRIIVDHFECNTYDSCKKVGEYFSLRFWRNFFLLDSFLE